MEKKPIPPGAARSETKKWVIGIGFAAFSVAMAMLSSYVIRSNLVMTLLTQAVISGVAATGVGFLIRQNGLVSFGHAAFYGLAAYSIATALKYQVIGAELAVIFALVLPTALAFLLGLVIVRIPGVAFSMLTLAIGQAFFEFAMKARHATGGEDGLSIPLPSELFGFGIGIFQKPHSMFVVCWAVLTLVIFAYWVFTESSFGQLTEAIRENEERARFIGYTTTIPRALVFAVSALIASLAGVLFALYNAFASPDVLHWTLSGSMLIMAIIGGPKLLWGPAFGAIVFFMAKDIAGNVTEHWQATIGLILIVVTVLLPAGLGGALINLVLWRRSGART